MRHKPVEIPTYGEISNIIMDNQSILDDEAKDLINTMAKLSIAVPTPARLLQIRQYKAMIENWYWRLKGIDEENYIKPDDVLDYLQLSGYKIAKSAFYAKFLKLVKKNNDGIMRRSDVVAIIKKVGLKKRNDTEEVGDEQAKKLEAEIRKLNAEAERREIQVAVMRGELVNRADVEQQLAARAAFLMDSLRNFGHSQLPQIIERTRGDITLAADMIDYYNRELEELFNYYSRPMIFNVPAALALTPTMMLGFDEIDKFLAIPDDDEVSNDTNN